jgi:hypothetical protein
MNRKIKETCKIRNMHDFRKVRIGKVLFLKDIKKKKIKN